MAGHMCPDSFDLLPIYRLHRVTAAIIWRCASVRLLTRWAYHGAHGAFIHHLQHVLLSRSSGQLQVQAVAAATVATVAAGWHEAAS